MPNVPYSYEVNGKLVMWNGSLIPIISSLTKRSLLPSLTVQLKVVMFFFCQMNFHNLYLICMIWYRAVLVSKFINSEKVTKFEVIIYFWPSKKISTLAKDISVSFHKMVLGVKMLYCVQVSSWKMEIFLDPMILIVYLLS